MNVYEMEGFLRGNGIPGDLKVNESNAQYLVRKFSELQSQNADLAVQLANAESKGRELASELSAVDKIHNEAVFITDDHYEQRPPEVQRMIRSLAVLQIPAYDAFLAEVRARAIPSDVMAAIQKVARIRIDLNDFDGDKRGIVDCLGEAEESLIEVVNKFAAQLRKGASL
ncbi:hypothetical protein [Citrobacter sp. Cpo044]|uniref:hypothetical protein n=1 Tax=Citrobacter sp. Cpo044 TaxID=2985127 RepID=UPI0025791EB0|nr:hypothetical protein [Citrobacter sp. Cpo044]MDM2883923.1 hypothetical protein [Citrobacter sp. Cpo044]